MSLALLGDIQRDAAFLTGYREAASLDTEARVWAGRESGDSIRFVPHIRLLGLGFGTDPR